MNYLDPQESGDLCLVELTQVQNPHVRRVIEMMTANLSQRHTLETLTEAVSVCPRHLEDLFLLETKLSPLQYLKRLRLIKAKKLLAESALSNKEIQHEIGIPDSSNFCHAFKQAVGETARGYRRRVRGR